MGVTVSPPPPPELVPGLSKESGGPRETREALPPRQVLEALSRIDLLRALPPEEVQAIVPQVDRVRYQAGETIFLQGDVGNALYMIDCGEALVLRDVTTRLAVLGPGQSFGEMALLTGEPRTATLTARTDLVVWRIRREDFERLLRTVPRLAAATQELAQLHREGLTLATAAKRDHDSWIGTALESMAARQRGLKTWHRLMILGLTLWSGLMLWETLAPGAGAGAEVWKLPVAIVQLVSGLLILQGACEALVQSVERLGSRLEWDGYLAGTIGAILSQLPDLVLIAFVVRVEPLAGIFTALATLYNNALVFSIYSFFLPKNKRGRFLMPAAIAKAGTEVLIAGAGMCLVLGLVMLGLKAEAHKSALDARDLGIIGLVLVTVFAYYATTLVRYYAESEDENLPTNPRALGHPTEWLGIVGLFAVGILSSAIGGESISRFAETALHELRLPAIPTAIGLAFFAAVPELVIVYKAHRRRQLGIALSSAFGGIVQGMFLLAPFTFLVVAASGLATGDPRYLIPINFTTTSLVMLLFPLFFVLLQYLENDHTLSNLDAAAMTGIYLILLYVLVFMGPGA
ncbi:MAG: cyclic nucleotide-binding domain-containing protein [Chloroflexi bacterium]|nr:cyclic nucleotide-binding domain-containing protein [Chloroflexota bacterium]